MPSYITKILIFHDGNMSNVFTKAKRDSIP